MADGGATATTRYAAALEAAGVQARVIDDGDTAAVRCAEHGLQRSLRAWVPVGPVRDAIAPALLQADGLL